MYFSNFKNVFIVDVSYISVLLFVDNLQNSFPHCRNKTVCDYTFLLQLIT